MPTPHDTDAAPAYAPNPAMRYVRVKIASATPRAPAADAAAAPTAERAATADATADDEDAETRARVRWADAEQMRATIEQRAPRGIDAGTPPWREVGRLASVGEAALLARDYEMRARPYQRPADIVVPLGVSATLALIATRVPTLGDAGYARSATILTPEEAAADPERAAAGEPYAEDAEWVTECSAGVDLRPGCVHIVDAAPEARFCVHACPLSRAPALMWRPTPLHWLREEAPLSTAVHGDEVLLVFARRAAVFRLALHNPYADVPEAERPTRDFKAEPVYRAALALVVDVPARFHDDADAASEPVLCALNASTLVLARGTYVYAWQRDGTVPRVALASASGTDCATPMLVDATESFGAGPRAYFAHARRLTCVRLDACTSEASRLLLCGDAGGGVLGLVLAAPGAAGAFGGLHFERQVLRAPAPIVALAFAGSRIVAASARELVLSDCMRAAAQSAVAGLGGGAIDFSIVIAEHEAPVALALWGDALLVHGANNELATYSVRAGARVGAAIGPKLREDVPPPRAGIASVVAAVDQAGVLLANGTLVFLNLGG